MNLVPIITELKTFTNVTEVIYADQEGKKPKYPYITLKSISESGENGTEIMTLKEVPSDDPAFTSDVEKTRIETLEETVSINIYAKDLDEAWNIAKQSRNWFKFYGYQFLKDNGMVVVSTSIIQNRDVLFVVDYERRCGFDVVIRITEKLSQKVANIEAAEIVKGE